MATVADDSSTTEVVTETASENKLTAEEQADGWLLLFDGETPFGWRPAGDANWSIGDGVVKVSDGEVCLFRTTSQYSDYILRADFRAPESTNSGIFLRTAPQPRDPGSDCYELNIAPPDNPFPTGGFVKRQQAVTGPIAENAWHTFEARCEGGKFTVQLDGQQVLDYTDATPLGLGFIGLQHNQGPVEFRNVKLKPLGLQPIFNGRDLAGWRNYPEMAGKFEVTATGELRAYGGHGQLESAATYDNFVLQFDAKCNGENLNSGLFFRCMPGAELMGYECQLNNSKIDGDASRPADCGSGGIFRRQNARRIVADDGQWFRVTLVVEGPHIATWVNGYAVADWTDTRKPHENPRKGMRTAAGTLMLQAHDETTDFSFRNIEIATLPPRRPTGPSTKP
ncbi:MAG: DUF1080 domain-containing protein [Planctomycetales bacterium]|nr:DUF1080 domain-containing protein [Planctomycetales bacterium]